jgi:hypothetical protein
MLGCEALACRAQPRFPGGHAKNAKQSPIREKYFLMPLWMLKEYGF